MSKEKTKMEIGSYDKLPHYSVGGDKTAMYLWVNEDDHGSSCEWIKGNEAFTLWGKLESLFKKDKKSFVELLKQQHSLNPKE